MGKNQFIVENPGKKPSMPNAPQKRQKSRYAKFSMWSLIAALISPIFLVIIEIIWGTKYAEFMFLITLVIFIIGVLLALVFKIIDYVKKGPEPKVQEPLSKTAKKTALFSKISILVFLGGIAYLIIGLRFLEPLIGSDNVPLFIFLPFVIAEIIAFIFATIGAFQIAFSKSRLTGGGYCGLAIIFGIILYVAVPNFLRFPARSYQSEAKQNLGAIYTAYQAYHSDYGTYPSSPSIQIGTLGAFNCLQAADWEPKGNIRYTYKCANIVAFSGVGEKNCPPKIRTSATKDSFTGAACGNMDNDETLDVWTINDAKKLKNVIDDVKE